MEGAYNKDDVTIRCTLTLYTSRIHSLLWLALNQTEEKSSEKEYSWSLLLVYTATLAWLCDSFTDCEIFPETQVKL